MCLELCVLFSLSEVSTPTKGVLAAARLLALQTPGLALNVLQRLDRPETGDEIDVFVATYLGNGLVHEVTLPLHNTTTP